MPSARPWHSRGFIGLALVVAVGALCDQITKRWAEAELAGRGITTVIEGVFQLRYTRNAGAFFGFGAGLDGPLRRGFFIVASVVALLLILNLLRKTRPAQRRLRWALWLLSAGAVGNLIDRVRRGSVTDFLHLHVGDVFHWATFNMADVYIAVGLCLLVFDMLRAAPVRGESRRFSDRDATTP